MAEEHDTTNGPCSCGAWHTIEDASNVEANKAKASEWLDASKINEFKLCPQRYAYRFEQHLVNAGNDDSALSFGSAIHSALESVYRGTGFDTVACPCNSPGCDYCKGNQVPRLAALFLAGYPTNPIDEKNPRTRNRGLALLEAYLTRWRREPFEVIAVEVPLEITMDAFRYVGRMDMIVRWDEVVMPLDHKTASRLGTTFDAQFKLSTQITGYIVGTGMVSGEPVNTACLNALRVSGKIDPMDSFERMFTTRTPEDIDAWYWEINNTFQSILHYRELGRWPKNAPYACVAYNRICPYYQLCTAGAATRETLIANAYEVKPWDPTDHD